MNICVRGVDENVFKRLKIEAAREEIPLGALINMAVTEWIYKREGKKKLNFLDFEPWDWGEGNEKASSEIDETLYGGKL